MPGKHSPIPIHRYFAIHETVLQQFQDDGVITELNLIEEWHWPVLEIYGRIKLRDRLILDIDKSLKITESARQPCIHTVSYSYNLSLPEGNIFRYDNAHPQYLHEGHSTPHHFHRFDPPGVQVPGSPFEVGNNWPTLGEVIQQADLYFWEHVYPKEHIS